MKDQYIWKKYFHLIWIKANDRIVLFTTLTIHTIFLSIHRTPRVLQILVQRIVYPKIQSQKCFAYNFPGLKASGNLNEET